MPQILVKSTAGIAYLRGAVEDALDELESEGIVSENACDYLELVFGTETDSPGTMLRELFQEEWPEGNDEGDDVDDEDDEHDEDDEDDEDEDKGRESAHIADQSESDKKAAARRKSAARKLLKMTLGDLNRQERKLHKK